MFSIGIGPSSVLIQLARCEQLQRLFVVESLQEQGILERHYRV